MGAYRRKMVGSFYFAKIYIGVDRYIIYIQGYLKELIRADI